MSLVTSSEVWIHSIHITTSRQPQNSARFPSSLPFAALGLPDPGGPKIDMARVRLMLAKMSGNEDALSPSARDLMNRVEMKQKVRGIF